MSQATRTCPGCQRTVNAAIPVCPFCGRRDPAAPPPAFGTARPAAAAPPRSPAGAIATGASAPRPPPLPPQPSARPARPAGPACPRCGEAPGPTPLNVEVRKQVPYWHPARRKYLVLSADLPGLCDDCGAFVRTGRRFAGVAMVGPFLLAALLAGYAGSVVVSTAVGLYGLWLLRAGSYGLADVTLYGGDLEARAAALIPRFPDGSSGDVRFPGGLAHAAARLGTAGVLGFVLAFAGAMAHQAGVGGPAFDPLSLLSRPSKVFVEVDGAGERFRLAEVDGVRAAIAHEALTGVRAGAALQVSPHDLMERALAEPEVEAVVFDPGPRQIVVPRSDFARLKLHLPLWQTPVTRVERP